MLTKFLIFFTAYICGSIPFGYILSHKLNYGDITQQGSGNIGATNAYRLGGKKLAGLTFLCDMLKAVIPVFVYKYFTIDIALLCVSGVIIVLGHIFPIWLRFRGGKGIAPTVGVMLMLNPMIAIIFIMTWVTIFFKKKISSLAAILAIITSTLISQVIARPEIAMMMLVLCTVILVTHVKNIKLLIRGEEKPIDM